MNKFLFIANNNFGEEPLSGGDTIFVNFIKYWKDNLAITVVGCEEVELMLLEEGFSNIHFIRISPKRKEMTIDEIFKVHNLARHIITRTYNGIKYVLKNKNFIKEFDHVYNISDFYPDFFPAFLCKLVNKRSKWLCGYYLFAPSMFDKASPYKNTNPVRGLLYRFMQLPTYFLAKNYADKVFVTSTPDQNRFVTPKRPKDDVIVVQGGVDTEIPNNYLNSGQVIPIEDRKYDACFMGRFHFQKGVIELIDIWQKVVESDTHRKLVMIGDGELMQEVKNIISEYGLEKNIILAGFKTGSEKHAIFKESKIVLHPATYDSGGMSAAEAMAWGLPAVGFDLPAYEGTYYPKGMVKVQLNDISAFGEAIIRLLNDEKYYNKYKKEAIELINDHWDWKKRSEMIFKKVFET
jgi:glycosyltransferase involved in cell wall biosynthesis